MSSSPEAIKDIISEDAKQQLLIILSGTEDFTKKYRMIVSFVNHLVKTMDSELKAVTNDLRRKDLTIANLKEIVELYEQYDSESEIESRESVLALKESIHANKVEELEKELSESAQQEPPKTGFKPITNAYRAHSDSNPNPYVAKCLQGLMSIQGNTIEKAKPK